MAARKKRKGGTGLKANGKLAKGWRYARGGRKVKAKGKK